MRMIAGSEADNVGSCPNAIKLGRICVIGQRLPQGLSRSLHQRILFGTPFADTRFIAIELVASFVNRSNPLK
jgi:hypothetical protein